MQRRVYLLLPALGAMRPAQARAAPAREHYARDARRRGRR